MGMLEWLVVAGKDEVARVARSSSLDRLRKTVLY
jgi:hypothetical protein